VGPVVVVLATELVDQGLELGEGGGLDGLAGEPVLQGLLESFDLALGLRVVAAPVLLPDAEGGEFVLERVASPAAALPGVADGRGTSLHEVLGGDTIPLSVSVAAGQPCSAMAVRKVAKTSWPVMRVWALMCRAYLEWSSSQVMTSTSAPVASR